MEFYIAPDADEIENVVGTDFEDEIVGNSLDNRLEGGGGDDNLAGGAGDDTFLFSGTSDLGTDTIITSDDDDGLNFSGLDFGAGVVVDLDAPSIQQVINNGGSQLTLDLTSTSSNSRKLKDIVGTVYDDLFFGNFERGVYEGLAGDDLYKLRDEFDDVTIVELAGGGIDTVDFSEYQGSGGTEIDLTAAPGVENVIGTDFDDLIVGNSLDNVLDGGFGDDTYWFTGNLDQGTDTIVDAAGQGNDAIDFTLLDLGTGVVFDLRETSSSYEVINFAGKRLVLDLSGAELENVGGTNYADTLTGTADGNIFIGNGGNDILRGLSGDDTYLYYSDNPFIEEIEEDIGTTDLGTDAIVELSGEGTDTLDFSELNFEMGIAISLSDNNPNQELLNNAGKRVALNLSSLPELENVIGTDLDDRITGNSLDNRLEGDRGDDTYVFSGTADLGTDTIITGDDDDGLDFSGLYFGVGVVVDLDSPTIQQVISNGGSQLTLDLTSTSSSSRKLKNIVGTVYDDVFFGNFERGVYEGLAGDDLYKLRDQFDDVTIIEVAGGGIDTIDFSEFAGSGGAIVDLTTLPALENVIGSDFNDTITGNSLDNIFDAGAGNDTIQGLFGSDTLLGGDGFDTYDLRLGEDPTADTITDSDGSFFTIFPDGSTMGTPQIFLTGNTTVIGGASIILATVSDYETSPVNLLVIVDGIAAEDITVTATGDVVWSPDFDESGQSYNATITVTDEHLNVAIVEFLATVTSGNEPEVSLVGNTTVAGGVSVIIATISDTETYIENLLVVVDGIVAENIVVTASGDIVWSPDLDEIGQTYNVTITVTDEHLNVATAQRSFTVAELDTDGDGLSDGQEVAIGTDPNDYDSDGDLLGDGFEDQYNLDPLDDDEDNNGTRDDQDNFDGDGLSNLDEQIFDTDPTNDDTDGDGTSDSDETDQGSNPNDSSDGGMAPEEDEIVELTLTVGDPSGSNSERYDLIVGDIRHQATQFGVVESRTYKFRRGESYEVQIVHRGSNLPTPDLDYTASIIVAAGETDPHFVDDPQGILGGGSNVAASFLDNTGTLYLPLTDLDISHVTTGIVPDDEETSVGGLVAVLEDTTDMLLKRTTATSPGDWNQPHTRFLVNDVGGIPDSGKLTLNFPSNLVVMKVLSGGGEEPVISGITEIDPDSSFVAYGTSESSAVNDVEVTVMLNGGGANNLELDKVKVTIVDAFYEVNVTTFIPFDAVWAPFPVSFLGLFGGDNRGFDRTASTFRTRQLALVTPFEEFDIDGLVTSKDDTGWTVKYDPETSLVDPDEIVDSNLVLKQIAKDEEQIEANKGAPYKIDWAKADGASLALANLNFQTNNRQASFTFSGNESDPLIPLGLAPGITYNLRITIDASGSILSPVVDLFGTLDSFPAFEIYIDNQTLYQFDPSIGGGDLWDLFPAMNIFLNHSTPLP